MLRTLLLTPQVSRRLLKYVVIGAAITLAYFALTNAAVSFGGIGAKTASVGVYLVMLPIAFVAHRRITFASRGQMLFEWVRFCSVNAANLLIVFEVSAIAVDRYALPPWIAFLIISVFIPIVNFVAFQMWVFASKSTRGRMTLPDPVLEQKCKVKSAGALSPLKDRSVVWFIASTSCLFTALIITQSLRQGKLSPPVSYDDIVYFIDAAHRLQILYNDGVGPCLASFFRDPPHAPLATLVPFVGFALLGMNEWAPAAVNVVWVGLLLLFIRLLLPEVPRWFYVIVTVSALAWPLTGYLVVECRPDIYAALLTVMGSVLMFQAPFLRASMRRVAIVAGLFGAAILAKPSISPLTLFLYCASIAINLIIEGRPFFDRKVLQKAALRVSSYVGITAAIVLPYFAVAWRDTYNYIYTVTLGSQKDIWGVPMSARDAAAFYFWGPGGQFMMGRWFWIAISLVAIDTLLGPIAHRPINPRKIGLYVIFLLAYAAVSIPSVKHQFIGVVVPTFILAFYVMACGSIAASLIRWGRYGQWGIVGFAALLLLMTGAAFDWPQAAANTHFTASRRSAGARR